MRCRAAHDDLDRDRLRRKNKNFVLQAQLRLAAANAVEQQKPVEYMDTAMEELEEFESLLPDDELAFVQMPLPKLPARRPEFHFVQSVPITNEVCC